METFESSVTLACSTVAFWGSCIDIRILERSHRLFLGIAPGQSQVQVFGHVEELYFYGEKSKILMYCFLFQMSSSNIESRKVCAFRSSTALFRHYFSLTLDIET